MAKNETINGLEFLKEKLFNGIYKDRLDCIDKAIEFINKNDWIPCTVVEYAKETTTEKEQIFLSFVLTTQIDVKCRDIAKRPPLPLVA